MKLIIEAKTESVEAAAFRVFDGSTGSPQVHYDSTRLNGTKDNGKYYFDVPDELAGKDYELKAIPSLEVISKGKVLRQAPHPAASSAPGEEKKKVVTSKTNDSIN